MILKDNIRVRKVDVEVKDKVITYDEYYRVDENGEEIFDKGLEIDNDTRLFEIYKSKSNLLTAGEIKKIRDKYKLTQKDYAMVLGVGEVTINRFEKGSIQSEAVDSIMRLSEDPDNMMSLLFKNKDKISLEIYSNLMSRIKELKEIKKHKLVDISNIDSKVLEFEESNAIEIAKSIINIYNQRIDEMVEKYNVTPIYITQLKLQKLLYYVQALCLLVFGKRAFPEEICAWSYGPVIPVIYEKYKNYHEGAIKEKYDTKTLSDGLYSIVSEVIDQYGAMDTAKLVSLTHEEEPWKNTNINEVINIESIKEYFNNVYDV